VASHAAELSGIADQTVAQGGSRTALLLRRANCDWDDRLEGEPGRVTGRDETVVEWGEPGRVEVN
jgi:hypothetical protein